MATWASTMGLWPNMITLRMLRTIHRMMFMTPDMMRHMMHRMMHILTMHTKQMFD
jgi:hypothetical protein